MAYYQKPLIWKLKNHHSGVKLRDIKGGAKAETIALRGL